MPRAREVAVVRAAAVRAAAVRTAAVRAALPALDPSDSATAARVPRSWLELAP